MTRKNKRKNKASRSKDVCQLCDDKDADINLVQCDKCDKWFHFSCVNIKSIKKKDPWLCPTCKKEPVQVVTQKQSCKLCHQIDNDEMVNCDMCDDIFHIACVDMGSQHNGPWKCTKCIRLIKSLLNVSLEANQSQSQPNNRQTRLDDCSTSSQINQRQINHDHFQHPNLQQHYSQQPNGPKIESYHEDRINNQIINHNRFPDHISFHSRSKGSHYSYTSSQNIQIELEYLQEEKRLEDKLARQKELFEREDRKIERKLRKEREHETELREKEFLEKKYQILRQGRNFGATHSGVSRSCYTNSWINDNFKRQLDIDVEFENKRINDLRFGNISPILPDVKDTKVVNTNVEPRPELPIKGKTSEHIKEPIRKEFSKSLDQQPQPQHAPIGMKQQSNKGDVADVVPGPIKPERILTKSQIAARHIMAKKLIDFYGDPLQWTMWLNTYENDTDMCGLSDVENLARLKDCLKGKARDAVKHRLLTPSAVPHIIDTLKLLYGRPELIVNLLLTKVREIPAPKPNKLETLVDYALEVKNITAEIEGAKLQYHLANPTLMHEIVEKLPTQQKIEWAKFKATKGNVTVSTLAEWLYSLAEVICTVTIPSTSIDNKENKNSKKSSEHVNFHQTDRSKGNTQTQVVNNSVAVNTSKGQCKICDERCPEVAKCPKFKAYQLDQRWDTIIAKRLCRNCFKPHRGSCRLKQRCEVNGCKYRHHPLLHRDRPKKDETTISTESPKELKLVANEVPIVTNNYHNTSIPNIFYRMVPVLLYYCERVIKTLAYLDEGSSGTLMEEELARELKMKGSPEQLCLQWTGNVHRIEEKSERLDVHISGQCGFSKRYLMKGVRTVEDLGLPMQTINKDQLINRFPYLRESNLIDYTNERPRILIGLPHAKLCTQLKTIEGDDFEPIASKSRIGWSLHGPTQEYHEGYQEFLNQHRVDICQHQHQSDEELHKIVKDYFTLENFGVQVNNALNICSKEDERALAILEKHTKCQNGRFETALLWKYDSFKLEDSYQMAKRRLICLEKSKPKQIKVINDTIMDYISKGYARKLTTDELLVKRPKMGYLPIFTVHYPKKPDKIRLVFDAAAKVNGTSLNDLLLKGPDQLNSLIDVLRRFREHPIAVCGDIIEMYHQIGICEEDKHVQRFLWRNGDTNKEPDIYVLDVMTFGATCAPSSAQYVKNKNAERFLKESPRAVEAIIKNTYVDDMMDGANSVDEAIQLIKDVQKIHQQGGFKISKFLSNSTKVLDAFGISQDMELKNLVTDPNQNTERVLGMFWNTKTDCFTFSLKFAKINADVISAKRYPTKREILQTLMSIFDPLGLLSNFMIRLKIMLQDIWRSKLQWDDQISSDEQKEAWDEWFKVLPEVERVQVPRFYRFTSESSIQLHMFVDASADAYSTVAYLRIETNQKVETVLLGSKARVAPIRYISIPRMELQSAILGTRLMTNIAGAQTFKINRRYLWTDSKTVMSWIRSDHKKYHQFVAHRIGEILENSDQTMWHWLPSKENVADEATKWIKTPNFEQTSRWSTGPEFLLQSEDHWPKEPIQIKSDTPEEMKIRCLYAGQIMIRLIRPEKFSNWNRMVRALAYVFRYVDILRAKVNQKPSPGNVLNQDDIRKSRNIIFRNVQYDGYPDEMIILARNRNLPVSRQRQINKSSSLYTCSPYLDENGLLRIRGRIDASPDVTHDTKRPIILPKMHRTTSLLINCYHRIYHHRNNETVVNELKQRFYIPQLRVMVRKAKKNCQTCKVKTARPQIPEMGDLPLGRLAVGLQPFTHTGIDYFGPIEVIDGRKVLKRWGVIFTCLTIRAIHIEIAYSIDTETCIMCIRNFIVKQGRPSDFYSDNGTNLVGADNELTRAVALLNQEVMAKDINGYDGCYSTWHFNPPHAQHQGGCWERLIRSIKTSLYEILPQRRPTDPMLRNLLMEIEFVVNSRPLTFVSLDHEDDEALTPNHFLKGSSNGSKPFVPMDLSGSPNLRSKWRENQRLTDMFWKRFVKEYLPTLTRRTKWFQPVDPLKVGDLVLMMDEDVPRNCYPRAKVIEVTKGSGNQVRSLKVQRWDNKIFIRKAHNLAKLDVEPNQEVSLVVDPRNNQTRGSVTDDTTVTDINADEPIIL